MQKNNVKVSVIIPIYNVEQYIEKAICSILSQTFVDFELILVNDGSKDGSYDICKKYSDKDNRIILISQSNQGAHIARNNGLNIATGKYICFFDGDDYVERTMLEDLYSIAEKNNSDLVVCGFNINTYYTDSKYTIQKYIPYIFNNENIENYSDKDSFRKYSYLNFDRNMFYPPWNKMYRTEYIKSNNISFPVTYRDDFPFVIEVIKDISKVTYTKNIYYNFIRKRSDSETQKFVSNLYDKREEEHKKMLDLYNYWGLLNDKNVLEMISRRYIDRIIECIVNLYNSECTYSNLDKKILINKYISSSNFIDAIKYAKPKKLYLKLMYIPLKLKNVNFCIIMCRFINYIKKNNIKLFSTLKMNR